MTRRELWGSFAAASLATSSIGCATERVSVTSPALTPSRKLVPVECSPDRVIRTVSGLRPYRRSGYVVRTDNIDGRTIIHHYGHGGAGITLSWGTAQLALEEARRTGQTDFAVLGCGVVGLSTARLFQRNGFSVTIYARDSPPNTTSNIAGGWWSPVTLYEPGHQSADFSSTFVRAATFAHRYYQNLTYSDYGVRWVPAYSLSNSEPPNASSPSPFPEIQALYPESRVLPLGEHPFAVSRVRRFWSILIEPAIYLNALTRDYLIAGGKIVIRNFDSVSAILSLKERAIVNCTGLGAKALFQDEELTPVKGQLTFLLPQPEVDYCTLGPGSLYMFPRHDGILLGGTHEEGVWDLAPDPSATDRILHGHMEIFGSMKRI